MISAQETLAFDELASDVKEKDVRVFLGKAELRILEKGNAPTYGLYRDLISESPDGSRKKLRTLGPLGIFRKAEGNEPVALRTIDPRSSEELSLFCLSKGSI